MKISIMSLTHTGNVRENNEDAVIVCADLAANTWSRTEGYIPLSDTGALAVVADGMGGAKAGEIASELAVGRIRQHFTDNMLPLEASDDEKHVFLQSAITKAGEDIIARVENDPDTIGMGTTIVVLWIEGSKAHIAWCGDSRCYVFHPSKGLRSLTKDHSYVQELVDKGEIQPNQMFGHPDSNLITRGLGDIDTDSTADTLTVSFSEGDIFLLCSDGLCGYCHDTAIENIIKKHKNNIQVCGHKLLEAALSAGGYDNISIAILATLPDSGEKQLPRLMNRLKHIIFPPQN